MTKKTEAISARTVFLAGESLPISVKAVWVFRKWGGWRPIPEARLCRFLCGKWATEVQEGGYLKTRYTNLCPTDLWYYPEIVEKPKPLKG